MSASTTTATPVPTTHLCDTDRVRFVPDKLRQRSASFDLITPDEYAALPPSIRKKYFSPEERLNITQRAASNSRRKIRSKQSKAPSSTRSGRSFEMPQRPRTSMGLHRRSSQRSRRELDGVSEEDAQWYHALPEKIRRQHFSVEEQRKFAARPLPPTQTKGPPLASVDIRPSTSGGTGIHHPPRSQSATSVGFVEVDPFKIKSFLDSSASARVPSPAATLDPSPPRERGIRAFSNASSAPDASTGMEALSVASRPSLGSLPIVPDRHLASRVALLTPIRLPPPRLRPTAAVYVTAPSSVRKATSSPKLSQSPVPIEPMPLSSSLPRNYQDHDARRRLRQPLITPDKFGQMLKWGFTGAPSAEGLTTPRTTTSLPCSSIHERHSSDISQDDRSTTSFLDPATPGTVSDDFSEPTTSAYRPNSRFSSSTCSSDGADHDQSDDKPTPVAPKCSDPMPTTALSHGIGETAREVTVHLTLTRPDLREPGLYPTPVLVTTRRRSQSTQAIPQHTSPTSPRPTGAVPLNIAGRDSSRISLPAKDSTSRSRHARHISPPNCGGMSLGLGLGIGGSSSIGTGRSLPSLDTTTTQQAGLDPASSGSTYTPDRGLRRVWNSMRRW